MSDESEMRKEQAPQGAIRTIDRRHFVRLTTMALSAMAAGGINSRAAIAGQSSTGSDPISATLTIQPTQVPNTVKLDASFASLSFEKSSINRSPVYLTSANTDLIGLLNALGSGVLRIGANSVDETTWMPNGNGETSGEVAPIDIANFANMIQQCPGWKVIYGLNYRGKNGSTASPALAAGEAQYAADQLGSQLLGTVACSQTERCGFVPSTVADDGDPIDVMVLMDEPAHVGCVLTVRLIGVIEARQTEGGKTTQNDRLIGVVIHSYSHENIRSISEVNKPLLDQVEEFFISYNKSRGKKFKVTGVHGPSKAVKRLQKAIEAYKSK